MYAKDGRLHYVYNWLGEDQQKLTSDEPIPSGEHNLAVSFEVKERDAQKSPHGPAKLFIDGREVAAGNIRTQPGFFGLEGVVTVGRDVGRPASDDYKSPATFRGGVINKVTVAVEGEPHTDPERQAEMAHSRD